MNMTGDCQDIFSGENEADRVPAELTTFSID